MIPLDRKAGDGSEEVRFGAEALQMLHRLADQHPRLPAGAFGAQKRHEGLLARAAILADALARLREAACVPPAAPAP